MIESFIELEKEIERFYQHVDQHPNGWSLIYSKGKILYEAFSQLCGSMLDESVRIYFNRNRYVICIQIRRVSYLVYLSPYPSVLSGKSIAYVLLPIDRIELIPSLPR